MAGASDRLRRGPAAPHVIGPVSTDAVSPGAPRTGSQHASGFRLGPVIVDVESSNADVLRWLTAFLVPSVEVIGHGRGEVVIRFTCSTDGYDALERHARARDVRPIPCLALDRRIISRPGWHEGRVTVLADRDRGCFYRIDQVRVDVVARVDSRRIRHGLMRIVRETLTTRWLARGGVLDLHASAFETQGRAVLIAGPKQSGKTTLLCHALSSRQARVMANDRVFVDCTATPPVAHGIPTIVSIRPETSRFFPALQGAASMSPAELAERLRTTVTARAPL